MLLAHEMSDVLPQVEQKKQLLRELSQREYLDAWLRDTLAGTIHIDIGYWRPADGINHFKKAEELFTRAWETAPDLPEPASYMISIARMGSANATSRDWFDRAVAAEMDYGPAYRRFEQVMWEGRHHQALYRFGLECLETRRFDTPVPLELFHQVVTLEHQTGQTGKFWRNPNSYAKLREMFEG